MNECGTAHPSQPENQNLHEFNSSSQHGLHVRSTVANAVFQELSGSTMCQKLSRSTAHSGNPGSRTGATLMQRSPIFRPYVGLESQPTFRFGTSEGWRHLWVCFLGPLGAQSDCRGNYRRYGEKLQGKRGWKRWSETPRWREMDSFVPFGERSCTFGGGRLDNYVPQDHV